MSWKYFLHNSTQNLTAGIKEDQFSHDSEGAGLILNEIGSILKDFHLEDQDSDINAESIQLTFNCSQNCMQVSYNFIHIKLNIQLRTQSITTMLDHIAEEQKYLTGIFFFFSVQEVFHIHSAVNHHNSRMHDSWNPNVSVKYICNSPKINVCEASCPNTL